MFRRVLVENAVDRTTNLVERQRTKRSAELTDDDSDDYFDTELLTDEDFVGRVRTLLFTSSHVNM